MVLITIVYILLSLFVTYPIILDIKNTLPGWPMDAYNYIWNIDTFWHEILNNNSPFFTNRIFYPIGANLVSHTYAPFISVLALPFLNNLSVYMNVLIMIAFVFAAIVTYKTIFEITKNKVVSFLGGVVYGFSPILVSYMVSQHYYFLFASAVLPLIPYYMIKNETKTSQKIYISLFLLWIIFFIDYYIFIIAGIFFMILLFTNVKGKYKDILSPILYAGVVPAIIYTTTFIIPNSSGINAFKENGYPAICNLNTANLVLSSVFNPMLKRFSNNYPIDLDTPSYYFGYTIFLIAVFGIIKNIRNKIFVPFLTFGVIILLLSIGPNLRYNNSEIILNNFSLFNYFAKIPFMNLVDCPKRFIVGAQFILAVYFSIGLLEILKIFGTKLKKLIVLIVTIFIFVEYSSFNIPTTSLFVPDVYKTISMSKNNKTVLEIPSGITESKRGWGYDWSISGLHLMQLYWQIETDKPRIGGYLSRVPDKTFEYYQTDPIIKYLYDTSTLNGTDLNTDFSPEIVNTTIDRYNLGFVVISPNHREEEFKNTIRRLFGEHIIKESKDSRGYYLFIFR